ncbi:MAG: hypothetical protein QOJ02_4075 [Acidobacteriota bacterium]|jgi:hypothetical protein|nr:hypothetical protein [Acidobacteriota bacterium]
MQENETAPDEVAASESVESNEEATATTATAPDAPAAPPADISYHAVEKDGQVTAIWEMQGRKHVRTIDPRSRQGQDILRLYTSDHQDEAATTAAASES